MNSSGGGRDSGTFRKVVVQRKDEKWWLPVPCVPAEGLSEEERKNLRHKRDCASQIHKAALAINDSTLNDMDIPDSYLTTLPKVYIYGMDNNYCVATSICIFSLKPDVM